MIDGLPSAQMRKDISTDEILYDLGGANLGDAVSKPGQPALNNHYGRAITCLLTNATTALIMV